MSATKTAPKFVLVHEMKWDASLLSVLPASHAVTKSVTDRFRIWAAYK